MCSSVCVVRGESREWCDTVGELARALNVAPESLSEHVAEHGTDICLCIVDFDALGARQATEAEDYPFVGYAIDLPAPPTPDTAP